MADKTIYDEDPRKYILKILKKEKVKTFGEIRKLTNLHPQKVSNALRGLIREQKVKVFYILKDVDDNGKETDK